MSANILAFSAVAALAIASGIGVIAFRNAIYSALSLIVNLLSLALFYLILNGMFIAAAQVLIYAGAIMVLFLFVVTMLSSDKAELQTSDRISWQRLVGVIAGIIFAAAASFLLLVHAQIAPDAAAQGSNNLFTQISAPGSGNTEAFGMALFHGFLFPFEVTSAIIVAAILGAVVLGRRSRAKSED